MARILIASYPFAGHVLPLLPIARELVGRGHEVRWYSGQKYQPKIVATGASHEPFVHALDFDEADIDQVFPGRADLTGVRQIKFDVSRLFVAQIEPQIWDLRAIQSRWPADVVLSEQLVIAAHLYAELGGPPHAMLGILPLGIRSAETAPFGLGMMPSATPLGKVRNTALHWLSEQVIFGSVTQELTAVCQRLGLPARTFSPPIGPDLMLQPTVPGFEYPISTLPPQLHFIGPIVPPSRDAPGFLWWPELQPDRAVVLVTQGTFATGADQLFRPALSGLAGEDLLVIAAGVDDLAGFGMVPANARLEPYVPFSAVLPFVNVFVTNGGYGGVQQALSYGVPIVVAGNTEDKAEVANRVQYAGVGINLKTGRPTPAQVKWAVQSVLSDTQLQQRARAMGAEMRRHDAPREAAGLIEALISERRPVPRSTESKRPH